MCSDCQITALYNLSYSAMLRMRKVSYKLRPLTFVDTPSKMAREVCSEEYEVKEASQVQNRTAEDDLATQKEFDFVERPSEDFFCPITFELLLNPIKRLAVAITSPKRQFAGCSVTGSRAPCVKNPSYPQCLINFTGGE